MRLSDLFEKIDFLEINVKLYFTDCDKIKRNIQAYYKHDIDVLYDDLKKYDTSEWFISKIDITSETMYIECYK